MSGTHLNILIPQWQGGGQDMSTFEGAMELQKNYLGHVPVSRVEVDVGRVGKEKNGIVGYDEILKQMRATKEIISKSAPRTIFAIGGGCDADVVPIAYMNQALDGDMALLYFDAHGDLNTPASSHSKYFYGMPLRTLLGEGDVAMLRLIGYPLIPSQLVMLGIRELDGAEWNCIDDKKIRVVSVEDINTDTVQITRALSETGRRNVYIHIDLDVLDPDEFPHVPIPAAMGIGCCTLLRSLRNIREHYNIVGLGLFEYQGSPIRKIPLLRELVDFATKLS